MTPSTHACPGCGIQIEVTLLACRTCWDRLPPALRGAVNRTWSTHVRNPRDLDAARAHRAARAAAVRWYRRNPTGGHDERP